MERANLETPTKLVSSKRQQAMAEDLERGNQQGPRRTTVKTKKEHLLAAKNRKQPLALSAMSNEL